MNKLQSQISSMVCDEAQESAISGFNECRRKALDLVKAHAETDARNRYLQGLDLYGEYEEQIATMAGRVLKPSFSDWVRDKLEVDPAPGNCGSGWMEDVNDSEKEKVRYAVRVMRGISDLRPGGVLSSGHWSEALSTGSMLARMLGETVEEIVADGTEWEKCAQNEIPDPYADPRRAQIVGYYDSTAVGEVRWKDGQAARLTQGCAIYSHPVVVPSAAAIAKRALGLDWSDVDNQARLVSESMHSLIAESAN